MSSQIDKILNLASEFEKLTKEADTNAFYAILNNYERNSDAIKDFVEALKKIAENFKVGTDMSDPVQIRIHELLNKQAHMVENCIPDVEYMDSEIEELASGSSEE
jgi:hypothetical protein